METLTAERTINQLFRINSGDFHATSELDAGQVPLISCGDTNNGLVGYFDIPDDKTHESTLTVAYNGQPLTKKFHPYKFGAKDGVAVLVPRNPMKTETLIYVAAMINWLTWRYSYGRKCFRQKLEHVKLPVLVAGPGEEAPIDEDLIRRFYEQSFEPVTQSISERMAFWAPGATLPEPLTSGNSESRSDQALPHLPGL